VFAVEDEALVLMTLEDSLDELGCQIVARASLLEEAVALACTVQCDVAILDINLAGRLVTPVADVLSERGRDGTVRWVMDRGRILREAATGQALEVVGVVLDITDINHAERRQRLLFEELNHRVKNTLAIVQSLAKQTLRSKPEPRDFGMPSTCGCCRSPGRTTFSATNPGAAPRSATSSARQWSRSWMTAGAS
jgi:DNA-binding NarL/FixJ family response regulator